MPTLDRFTRPRTSPIGTAHRTYMNTNNAALQKYRQTMLNPPPLVNVTAPSRKEVNAWKMSTRRQARAEFLQTRSNAMAAKKATLKGLM